MKKYDAIIIGSGQAGNPLATALAKAGKKTLIVEKRFIGGTCVNDGCTPSKTLISSGKIARDVRISSHWGIDSTLNQVDVSSVQKRRADLVEISRKNNTEALENTENLDVLMGKAQFTGPKELQISLDESRKTGVTAPLIFINTGARPAIPDIDGLTTHGFLTSTELLSIPELPEKLLIIGAGYIALELGQLFARLGSSVTMLEAGDAFLPKEDRDVAEELLKILRDEGLDIKIGTKVRSVAKSDGKYELEVESGGKRESLIGSHLLVAAGRRPHIDGLSLDKTGVKINEKDEIIVNERLETSVEGIYALGDVKGGLAFTHVAYNDYVVVRKNLLDQQEASTNGRLIPYVVFTDPELARIGLNEVQAKKENLHYQVLSMPMNKVARAAEAGDTRGLMKVLVEKGSGKILGASLIGSVAGETLTSIQMAMLGNLKAQDLSEQIFAHPTYAEALNNLFSQFESD